MSIKESFAGKLNQELGSRVAGNIVFSDFAARVKRTGIVGIYGIVSNPEAIRELRFFNVTEFPKKGSHNLKGKVEKVLDSQGRLVRQRRGSRCHQPGHEPSNCHRGTGCRAPRVMKLVPSQTANNRPRTERSNVFKFSQNRPAKDFKKAS